MVRKVGVLSLGVASSSRSGSSEFTSGRVSVGSSTRSVFGGRNESDSGSQEVQQLPQHVRVGASRPGPSGRTAGYDTEESVRDRIDHTRFTINHIYHNDKSNH